MSQAAYSRDASTAVAGPASAAASSCSAARLSAGLSLSSPASTARKNAAASRPPLTASAGRAARRPRRPGRPCGRRPTAARSTRPACPPRTTTGRRRACGRRRRGVRRSPADGRRRRGRRRRGPAAPCRAGWRPVPSPAGPAPRRPGPVRAYRSARALIAPAGGRVVVEQLARDPLGLVPLVEGDQPLEQVAGRGFPVRGQIDSSSPQRRGVGRRGRPARRRRPAEVARHHFAQLAVRVVGQGRGVVGHAVEDHRARPPGHVGRPPGGVRPQPRLVRRPVAVGGLVVLAALAGLGLQPVELGVIDRRAEQLAVPRQVGRLPVRQDRTVEAVRQPSDEVRRLPAECGQQLLGAAERGSQRPVARQVRAQLPQAGRAARRR